MNRAGGAVVRFCRMTRTKWGLRAPTPRGTFLYGQKGTKKPPGEGPRSPPASPSGRCSIFCLFALCCGWADSTDGASPSSAGFLRLPTGPIGGPCCGTSVRCERPAESAILSSRAAVTEVPRPVWSAKRWGLFTGHRSSSPGSVSENPPLFQGAWGDTPSAFLGTFCAYKKYPRGAGARSPRIYEKRPEAYTIVRFRPFL